MLEQAQADAQAGATHEEARPENDKDTRAVEASYLARGQAQRVAALRLAVAEVRQLELTPPGDTAALGSLVTATEDGVRLRYFLAPQGGGTKLPGGVQVVTPQSPLGVALVGKRAGDSCELVLAGRRRELTITRVE